MKYLILKHKDTNIERAYLFSESEKHADFAALIAVQGWCAVRGGFVQFLVNDATALGFVGKLKVYGEAFSLGLTSEPMRDYELIAQELVK